MARVTSAGTGTVVCSRLWEVSPGVHARHQVLLEVGWYEQSFTCRTILLSPSKAKRLAMAMLAQAEKATRLNDRERKLRRRRRTVE